MIDWIDRLMSTELAPVVGAAEVLLKFLLVFDCCVTLLTARKQAFRWNPPYDRVNVFTSASTIIACSLITLIIMYTGVYFVALLVQFVREGHHSVHVHLKQHYCCTTNNILLLLLIIVIWLRG